MPTLEEFAEALEEALRVIAEKACVPFEVFAPERAVDADA